MEGQWWVSYRKQRLGGGVIFSPWSCDVGTTSWGEQPETVRFLQWAARCICTWVRIDYLPCEPKCSPFNWIFGRKGDESPTRVITRGLLFLWLCALRRHFCFWTFKVSRSIDLVLLEKRKHPRASGSFSLFRGSSTPPSAPLGNTAGGKKLKSFLLKTQSYRVFSFYTLGAVQYIWSFCLLSKIWFCIFLAF